MTAAARRASADAIRTLVRAIRRTVVDLWLDGWTASLAAQAFVRIQWLREDIARERAAMEADRETRLARGDGQDRTLSSMRSDARASAASSDEMPGVRQEGCGVREESSRQVALFGGRS
jgi:hypothetical protein